MIPPKYAKYEFTLTLQPNERIVSALRYDTSVSISLIPGMIH